MTAPYYTDDTVTLHHGDALDVLTELPDASVDSVVTDPPYGLANTDPAHVAETITRWVNGERDYLPGGSGFMGKAWDAFVPPVAVWDECLRVLKPGGHVLAFAGSRTVDLMTLGLRLAGFDIRDSVAWLYGSGFPKSLDVSKSIDKAAGAERTEVIGSKLGRPGMARDGSNQRNGFDSAFGGEALGVMPSDITAPATPDARTWQGWGTALKPAFEPVVVARKPLAGTVPANVLAHGTGALNIDGCRVSTDDRLSQGSRRPGSNFDDDAYEWQGVKGEQHVAGRWPANVVLDESQAAALDEQSGESVSRQGAARGGGRAAESDWRMRDQSRDEGFGDSGGASRFFPVFTEDEVECLCPPNWNAERVVNPLCPEHGTRPIDHMGERFRYVAKADASERVRVDGIAHPTVKPLALMRWLVRLVTPPGGTVLEPFAGSGTTVEACILEGFRCVAIEREADYLPLITQRINRRRDPVEAVRRAGEDAGLFDLLGEASA